MPLVGALCLLGSPAVPETTTARSAETTIHDGPPNVVIVLTDDQRVRTMNRMPRLWKQVRRKGVLFTHAGAPTSLCCPARASLLTGLYAHSTRVYRNGRPYGGWRTFRARGLHRRTLATALDAVGYHTALVGKLLNGYPSAAARGYVAPGWDEQVTFTTKSGKYNYRLSDGKCYGEKPADYQTDVLRRHAVRIIRNAPADQPLFLYFAPTAPHRPYIPAPRHKGDWAGRIPSYRPAAVREDVSDKPPWVRMYPRRSQQRIDADVVGMQEMLMSVDEAVGALVRALEDTDRMDNTLFIYTSDNGLMLGEHHLLEWKYLPYRWSTSIPLVMRWDGHIPKNRTDGRLALNIDLATTINRVVGGTLDTEGLDLLGRKRRSGYPLEALRALRFDSLPLHPSYCGYRTARWLYVRYNNGFRELYDYRRDPQELTNKAYAGTHRDRVRALRAKARATCRPVPPGYSW
ncbi:sulfatase family protein [Nocardioides guangzhouensis]|uniref:sulfatase family protein n=1 Tax=Nocardioides guangzhouensis TaxID=2497878 RepID=UPI0014384C7D|nr:sulfatase [Nocardioides guangzhouensis]